MNDHSLAAYWIACVIAGMFMTGALYAMKPARSEQARPAVALPTFQIELKRDRRRSPKFLKLKQRKEQNDGTSRTSR